MKSMNVIAGKTANVKRRINMINFKENIGKKVTISGFAEKVRNLQWIQFIIPRCEGKRIPITI